MTRIEDEVGLFEGERIGIGRRPLLQYLIANRPHQYAGMVAVTQYHVCQVALMPLIEETGIVVLGLATSPHVKRLIHDNETHRVTHVQQFGSRWIVAGTDGIDTHLLQLEQLAMEGILAECCSETS